MKHYINDSTGEVIAPLPKDGFREMTPEEFEAFKNPPKSDEQIALEAQSDMISELSWADIEVKKHVEGHSRTISTIEVLYEYKNKCRDYVRDIDGVLTISGEKPERPQ